MNGRVVAQCRIVAGIKQPEKNLSADNAEGTDPHGFRKVKKS
jgi:hypothetical protein